MRTVAVKSGPSRIVRSERLVPGYVSLAVLAAPGVVVAVVWTTLGWVPALLSVAALFALGVLGNVAEWGVERMSAGRSVRSIPSAEK